MKAKAVMIDPESCDSTIVIKFDAPQMKRRTHEDSILLETRGAFYVDYDARISISDCNRWIEWDFRSFAKPGYNITKIDNVIKALSEFRRELVKAESKRKVLAEKVKQKNETIKLAKKNKVKKQ